VKFIKRAFFAFLWLAATLGADEPLAIYLTWTDDPTSTMVVQWMTPKGTTTTQLGYHEQGQSVWISAKGEAGTVEDCDVHRIHLEGLKEDREYVFKLEGDKRQYRFKTMPKKLTRPVRMAIGGDAYYGTGFEVFHRMNRTLSFNHPDFVVIGGDIAYTNGTKHFLKGPKWALARWQTFLRELQKTLSREGRLIPILPVIGNHDVHKPKHRTEKPELFYEIFTFPEKGKAYRSLDFGDYLSLVMLDTGHTWQVEGEQTAWLAKTLQSKSATYVFAAYHIAAYPSHSEFTGKKEERIRKNWVPLFEKYFVPFAFEHHNHTYKRTHPLKEGKINPGGVTYLGDGSWGVPTRKPKSPEERWYLAKSESINSCFIVTLTQDKCLVEAKNNQNQTIDQVESGSKASLTPALSE